MSGDNGKSVSYGRVPYGVVASGAIAALTPAAKSVYLVLCAHCQRRDTWTVHPGMDTIAQMGGLTKRAAINGVNALESAGIIEVNRGGGRGHASTYTIKGERGFTVSEVERVNGGARKGERRRQERVNGEAVNSERGFTPIKKKKERKQQQKKEASTPPAAVVDSHSGEQARLRDYLVSKGIGEPTLSEFVNKPGLTVSVARDILNRLGNDAGPGLRVNELRAQADRHIIRERRERERKAEAEARREREFAEDLPLARVVVDAMSDDQRACVRKRVEESYVGIDDDDIMTCTMARHAREADGERTPALVAAIAAWVDREEQRRQERNKRERRAKDDYPSDYDYVLAQIAGEA